MKRAYLKIIEEFMNPDALPNNLAGIFIGIRWLTNQCTCCLALYPGGERGPRDPLREVMLPSCCLICKSLQPNKQRILEGWDVSGSQLVS